MALDSRFLEETSLSGDFRSRSRAGSIGSSFARVVAESLEGDCLRILVAGSGAVSDSGISCISTSGTPRSKSKSGVVVGVSISASLGSVRCFFAGRETSSWGIVSEWGLFFDKSSIDVWERSSSVDWPNSSSVNSWEANEGAV
jgi:hypothetical protein